MRAGSRRRAATPRGAEDPRALVHGGDDPLCFLVAWGFFVRGLYDEDLARASFGVWGANLPAL
ncbi:MAG: hypothetical protein WCY95_08245, partial [Castellaniella sp.]